MQCAIGVVERALGAVACSIRCQYIIICDSGQGLLKAEACICGPEPVRKVLPVKEAAASVQTFLAGSRLVQISPQG